VYGVSKVAADLAAFQYATKDRLEVVRVRPFAHTGPGQSPSFALSSFAKQVAMIKLGRAAPAIRVGNLEVKRDYSDVSDIVRGYREALLNGKRGGVYNLCSGHSVAIGDLLHKLLKIAEVEAEITVDESRVRDVDISEIYGSPSLAQKELGWHQRIDIEGTLHGLFAYWMESLG
jgi:GDP-4-dehydro-6-deoxy-D-mannose reductase